MWVKVEKLIDSYPRATSCIFVFLFAATGYVLYKCAVFFAALTAVAITSGSFLLAVGGITGTVVTIYASMYMYSVTMFCIFG